jgi:transposase
MKELPDLKQLSGEAKDALIVLLWEELQKLQQAQFEKLLCLCCMDNV